MVSVWSISKLSTEWAGSRRELVANSVHTAGADATQVDSNVESRRRCVLGIGHIMWKMKIIIRASKCPMSNALGGHRPRSRISGLSTCCAL